MQAACEILRSCVLRGFYYPREGHRSATPLNGNARVNITILHRLFRRNHLRYQVRIGHLSRRCGKYLSAYDRWQNAQSFYRLWLNVLIILEEIKRFFSAYETGFPSILASENYKWHCRSASPALFKPLVENQVVAR